MWSGVLPVLSLQFTKRVLCWVPGPPLSSSYWTDCHVVLCSLVDCTVIWPPCGTVFTGGMHNDLTTMWHCYAQWSDHHVALCSLVKCTMIWVNFSLYMILICLIWLQLLSLIIREHVPLHHSEFVFKIHQSLAPSLHFSFCRNMAASLWAFWAEC